MDTPIRDFVAGYADASPLRLHMPGHKGLSVLGVEAADITEISGADVLYQPDGIIARSEENAAALFGSRRTVYSTEGSSLPIRAMLYLVRLLAASRGEQPRIAAGRNAHKVFVTAAALLGIPVDWLRGREEADLIGCRITPEELDRFLGSCKALPTAVYITSPDYLGTMADIAGLSRVCKARGVLLLVDNAHGAYLRFLPESLHPMDLGADLCCDSAHKTLPVLTGGAYLHIGKSAPVQFDRLADRAMAMFASTSPSYLILQSLDLCNRALEEGFPQALAAALPRWAQCRSELEQGGFRCAGSEPMKLTLLPKSRGYTGTELAQYLEGHNVFCEFADPDHLVMMLSPAFTDQDARRVTDLLLALPPRAAIEKQPPVLPRPVQAVAPEDAIFLDSEEIPAADSLGRIMASPTVSCPPAIPIVACGERIDAAALRAMAYYGIDRVQVLL